MNGLYYDWQAPFILAESGFAVIAPDYAGQDSDIPQGFMRSGVHACRRRYLLGHRCPESY